MEIQEEMVCFITDEYNGDGHAMTVADASGSGMM